MAKRGRPSNEQLRHDKEQAESLLQSEIDKALKLLQEGKQFRFIGLANGYRVDGMLDSVVSVKAVRELRQRQLVKDCGDGGIGSFITLSSPEEYAQKKARYQAQLDANKAKWLEYWRHRFIKDLDLPFVVLCDGEVQPDALNDVLLEFARWCGGEGMFEFEFTEPGK